MNNLFERIFDEVIASQRSTAKVDKRIYESVQMLIAPYAKTFDAAQMEELRNTFYGACDTAQKAGFELGILFMLRLMKDLLSDF